MNTLFFDLELIKKYDVSAPRYTSYPPATQFTAELSSDLLYEKIRENNKTEENKPERDLSLYFHLPFCHSLCWYCGCTTVITRQQKKANSTLIT